MVELPDSLAIALWVVGACWAMAIIAWIYGASGEWTVPLVTFGALTGLGEWLLRRQSK